MKAAVAGLAVLLAAACQAGPAVESREPSESPAASTPPVLRPSPSRLPTSRPPARPAPPIRPTTPQPLQTVVVPYRLEDRTAGGTPGFATVVERTLSDRRGWARAGFRLQRQERAPYLVVLAEPDETQQLCEPYDVYRTYSCQNGPVVALNAERWRTATPKWTGTLAAYRVMLVNHEVGHLLGMTHPPDPQCPRRGRPAPIMAQQSTELNGCLPNPWPLAHEIDRAARHDRPLAPPPVSPTPDPTPEPSPS